MSLSKSPFWTICGALAVLCSSVGYTFASPAVLVPHRAVYDLQLEHAEDKAGITGLSGRMVYELDGAACEGYTTRFRFVTRVDMDEMPQRLTDQQTATYESADGKLFRFTSKTFVDQELAKELSGTAEADLKAISVKLDKPQKLDEKLALAQFPVKHMEDLIDRAIKGEKVFQADIFDGSEDGNKIAATTVIIGNKEIKENAETTKMGKLGLEESWPVTIAYYDDEQNIDGLPIYRTNFELYANGVTRDLHMDYGDFSMRGTLVKFELLNKAKDNCAGKVKMN